MTVFRVIMVFVLLGLSSYTLATGLSHGWNFLPVFLGDLRAVSWQGQFNFDFLTFLLLTGFWVAWRNGFSFAGIALGGLVACFGMLVLAAYVLFLSFRTGGDMLILLLGVHAKA